LLADVINGDMKLTGEVWIHTNHEGTAGNYFTDFVLFVFVLRLFAMYTWLDNKVRELTTVCLPWQHWTKVLLWFDDVDISAFHSCVAVDL